MPACTMQAARPSSSDSNSPVFDRQQCDHCETMDCIELCYSGALQPSGRWYTVDEVMRVFNRDQSYWGAQGGITLTGGEPLMQEEFVLELLERCHDAYMTVCVETSGYVRRNLLQAILPHTEWLFIDIKHMDSSKHLEGTGVPNELILENIRWIANSGWPGRMVLRMPVIPGFNDSVANAQASAAFLGEIGQSEINLLPFHRLGASKYEQLGMTYTYAEQPAVAQETLESLATVYRQRAITCHLGADTPF